MRLTFQQLKKVQFKKLYNIPEMGSSDKETLLKSDCFFLNYHQKQVKKRKKKDEKDVGAVNI